jgi:hypothetical protein
MGEGLPESDDSSFAAEEVRPLASLLAGHGS